MRQTVSGFLRRSGADWKDLLCILILIIVCLQLRLPALDRVALNPDESQYEAAASYLQATGRSAFEVQHAPNGTYFLFRMMGELFGPYPMFEVRILVLIIVLLTALMLYAMLRRKTTWWSALAGGLLFLHLNLYFEGHSANREWFAGSLLALSLLLCSLWVERGGEDRHWIIVLSGAAAALSIFFKLHAAPMLLVLPAFLLWRLITKSDRRNGLLAILACGAGMAAGLAISFAGFASAGKLGEFLQSIVRDWNVYTMGNVADMQAQASVSAGIYLERLYLDLPFRPLWLTASGISLLCIGATLWNGLRKRAGSLPLADPTAFLMALFHLSALVTVSLGQRFFGHYNLFKIFPAAWLVCFALHILITADEHDSRMRNIAWVWVLAILTDRLFYLISYSPPLIPLLAYALPVAALLFFALLPPRRRIGLAAAGLICMEICILLLQGQLLPTPRSLPYHRHGFTELVEQLEQNGERSDRLFVWGWAPEIYSLARMEAASIYSICQYVVDDTIEGRIDAELNAKEADQLMRDLRRRPPRFIVDAAPRSWTMVGSGIPWIYHLSLYPEFELVEMIKSEYRLLGTFDGCALHERKETN